MADRTIGETAKSVSPTTVPGHELVGARRVHMPRVGWLPELEQVHVWTRVASGVIKRGFVFEYRDLEPPRTGIFDGQRVVIDPDVGFEMQCFVLLHLFGHSVQWVAPSLEHKLAALITTTDKVEFIGVLRAYEYEAAGYGLTLLHDVGIRHLDQWFSDFVATDWQYVERFYREDRIPPWDECIMCDSPPITPLAIPPLAHRLVEVRYAF